MLGHVAGRTAAILLVSLKLCGCASGTGSHNHSHFFVNKKNTNKNTQKNHKKSKNLPPKKSQNCEKPSKTHKNPPLLPSRIFSFRKKRRDCQQCECACVRVCSANKRSRALEIERKKKFDRRRQRSALSPRTLLLRRTILSVSAFGSKKQKKFRVVDNARCIKSKNRLPIPPPSSLSHHQVLHPASCHTAPAASSSSTITGRGSPRFSFRKQNLHTFPPLFLSFFLSTVRRSLACVVRPEAKRSSNNVSTNTNKHSVSARTS